MTLNEAIDEQFKNLHNEDPVYVRVHCVAVIPARAGYRTKYFFTDVIQYKGEKAFLKLIPHYGFYRDWKVSENAVSPAWIRPDNEFECCVEKPVSEIVDMSLGRVLREIDISEENF